MVESGSSPLPRAQAGDFDETVAITQLADEPPAAFAGRALSRIASVERSQRLFEAITVLTGPRQDAGGRSGRRALVLGLSTLANRRGRALELLLQARGQASDDERCELLQLAGEATEASRTLVVTLRFAEQDPAKPASLAPGVKKLRPVTLGHERTLDE